MPSTLGWLDVHRIAEELADRHPEMSPISVKFVDLRRIIAALPGFQEESGHPVNEKILETIQMLWQGEATSDDDD